jgi:hypothetical protein
MDETQKQIRSELSVWQKQMLQKPTIFNRLSKSVQVKINTWIPEKVHQAITATIKQMIRGVLFGANYTTAKPLLDLSLPEREATVEQRIKFYKTTAAVEGGITGAGGILLGFADFPILIGLKLKLLFDICSMYGFNVKDYKERFTSCIFLNWHSRAMYTGEKFTSKWLTGMLRAKIFRKISTSSTGEIFSRNTATILILQKWPN